VKGLRAAEVADAPVVAAAAFVAEENGDSDDDDDDPEDVPAAAAATADPGDEDDDDAAAAARPATGMPELVAAAIRIAETSKSRIVPLNTAKMLHRVALDQHAAMPHIALLPEDCLELYDAIVAQLKQVRVGALLVLGMHTHGVL